MKHIDIKLVSKGMLGAIILQSVAVGVELHRNYSKSQETHFILRSPAAQYCFSDIRYGVITNPLDHLREPSQNETKELKIYLIGTTTGTSGDSAIVTIPV